MNGLFDIGAMQVDGLGEDCINITLRLVDMIFGNVEIHKNICNKLIEEGIQKFGDDGVFLHEGFQNEDDASYVYDDCGNIRSLIEFASRNDITLRISLGNILAFYSDDGIILTDSSIYDELHYRDELEETEIELLKEQTDSNNLHEAIEKIGNSVILKLIELCNIHGVMYTTYKEHLKSIDINNTVKINISNL